MANELDDTLDDMLVNTSRCLPCNHSEKWHRCRCRVNYKTERAIERDRDRKTEREKKKDRERQRRKKENEAKKKTGRETECLGVRERQKDREMIEA